MEANRRAAWRSTLASGPRHASCIPASYHGSQSELRGSFLVRFPADIDQPSLDRGCNGDILPRLTVSADGRTYPTDNAPEPSRPARVSRACRSDHLPTRTGVRAQESFGIHPQIRVHVLCNVDLYGLPSLGGVCLSCETLVLWLMC